MSKDLKPGEEYSNISRYYQMNIDVEDFLGVPYEVCHLKGDTTNKFVMHYYKEGRMISREYELI